MCKIIVLLLSFLCIILCSGRTVHSCQLFVRYPSPLFSKTFGSKNITFRSTENGIQLSKGESIQAYCSSGIIVEPDYISYNRNPHKMASFFCDENNYIHIRGLDFDNIEAYTIYCSSSSSSSLYESKNKMPNCDESLSYGIGEKIPLMGTIIKLAICYDIQTFALKYANYIAYEKKDILISPEIRLDYSFNEVNLKGSGKPQNGSQARFGTQSMELRTNKKQQQNCLRSVWPLY